MLSEEGTNQACKYQPVIGSKVFGDLEPSEYPKGDDQTNEGQENQGQDDVFLPSFDGIHVVWLRP